MKCIFIFPELTPEQQKILIEIRKRKTELLLEIQVSIFIALIIFIISYNTRQIFRCQESFYVADFLPLFFDKVRLSITFAYPLRILY